MTTRAKTRSEEQAKTPSRRDETGPPGSRSSQRDTVEQLENDAHPARPDEPTAWERELQDRLPPRGEGSQHNQGDDAHAKGLEPRNEDTGPVIPGTQTGGPRGPSNAP